MVLVKMKVKKGDGTEYETVADVTEEAAKEMLKRDDVKLAEKSEKKAAAKDEEEKPAEKKAEPKKAEPEKAAASKK